jgi:aldose 1-epimerase
MPMSISQVTIGSIDSKKVYLFTINHPSGAQIQLTNYGATWTSAMIPDNRGVLADVLLGYNDLNGYLSDTNYMGSTVGRFANRINRACFTINHITYFLDKNDGDNTNHGGFSGINKQVFESEVNYDEVVFSLKSPDGHGGFPGNVFIKVSYSFSVDLMVVIKYWAVTDKDTYLNLTNHAYFNLAGTGSILKHQLQVSSSEMLETNENFIPTGKLIPVVGTEFDFTRMRSIGDGMNGKSQQIIWNRGYNHCYPVTKTSEGVPTQPAATLFDPLSGRMLQLFTTLPSVLVYSAGYLNSILPGKSGLFYKPCDGICLEAQFYPDSPNQVHFPSCLIRKNQVYNQYIKFHFTVVENN